MKLTVNLHEKLQKYNEVNHRKDEDLILQEANQLLNNSYKEDLAILNSIGLNKNLTKASEINKKRETENTFKEVYDISAIKKLAVNYGLRFLPSRQYTGTIDPILPTKIKEFISNHNIDMSLKKPTYSRIDTSEFYILAPRQSFELEERPKDPIIFYKINDEKYAFVHKWGNDLNASRYIANLPVRSQLNFFLFMLISWVLFWGIYHYTVGLSEESGALCLVSGLLTFFSQILLSEADFNNRVWDDKFRN